MRKRVRRACKAVFLDERLPQILIAHDLIECESAVIGSFGCHFGCHNWPLHIKPVSHQKKIRMSVVRLCIVVNLPIGDECVSRLCTAVKDSRGFWQGREVYLSIVTQTYIGVDQDIAR